MRTANETGVFFGSAAGQGIAFLLFANTLHKGLRRRTCLGKGERSEQRNDEQESTHRAEPV
jgi:hypothetical protein